MNTSKYIWIPRIATMDYKDNQSYISNIGTTYPSFGYFYLFIISTLIMAYCYTFYKPVLDIITFFIISVTKVIYNYNLEKAIKHAINFILLCTLIISALQNEMDVPAQFITFMLFLPLFFCFVELEFNHILEKNKYLQMLFTILNFLFSVVNFLFSIFSIFILAITSFYCFCIILSFIFDII